MVKNCLVIKILIINLAMMKDIFVAITTPNALLAKFLSNCDSNKFCLRCFNNFQNEELHKQHKKYYTNSG